MKQSMVGEQMRKHIRREKPVASARKTNAHTGKAMTFLAAFLWLLFFGVVGYVAIFSSLLRIESFDITGQTDISEDMLRENVEDLLSSKYIGVIPKNTFFLFPEDTIRSILLERFPKLSGVSFRLDFPNTLSISFADRERVVLYCSAGPCYLIDDDGVLRDARYAEQEENHPYTISILNESAQPAAIGDRVFTLEQRQWLLEMDRLLRAEIDTALSPTMQMRSFSSGEVRLLADEGWEVFVSTTISPKKLVASLALFLDRGITKEDRARLRYVDLRAEGKVFYVFQENHQVIEAISL